MLLPAEAYLVIKHYIFVLRIFISGIQISYIFAMNYAPLYSSAKLETCNLDELVEITKRLHLNLLLIIFTRYFIKIYVRRYSSFKKFEYN